MSCLRALGLACLLVVVSVGSAQGATRTWNGPGGGNWSEPTNWLPNGPWVPNDELVFPATSSASSNNDIPAGQRSVLSIRFEGTHTIVGEAFFLWQGLETVDAGIPYAAAINVHMSLGSGQTWTIGANTVLTTTSSAALASMPWNIAVEGNLIVGGVISGDGGIAKTGTGTLRLAAANDNTFTGPVTVGAGRLILAHPSALGAHDGTPANGTSVSAGAALILEQVSGFPDNEPLTLNGSGPFGEGALSVVSDAPFELRSPITLAGPTTVTADTGALSNALSFTGAIGGGQTLVILDTTDFTIGSSSNQLAGIDFGGTADGALRLAATSAFQGALKLPAPVTFDMSGYSITLTSLTGNGSVTTTAGSSTLIVSNATPSLFSGTIGGAIDLAKQGAGELVLSGANSYTGETNISAGTLRVTHVQGLGAGDGSINTGVSVLSGATLALDAVSPASERMSLQGTGTTLHVTGPTPVSLSGFVVSGAGARLTGDNAADLTFAGGYLFSGLTELQGITVRVLSATAAGSGELRIATGSALLLGTADVLGQGVTAVVDGMLAIGAGEAILGGLSGSGTIALPAATGLRMIMFSPSTFSGTLTGSGTFAKHGPGTLTLAGATTFTGAVAIEGGTLRIAHSQALASASSIVGSFGATLSYAAPATTAAAVSLAGSGNGNSGAALEIVAGPVTFSGPMTLGTDLTTVHVAGSQVLTWQTPVSAARLALQGTGTTVFGSSGNTLTDLYVGVSGEPGETATVRLGAANALPASFNLSLGEAATFDLGGFDQALSFLVGKGRVAVGTGTLTISPPPPGGFFEGTFSGTGAVVLNIPGAFFSLKETQTLTGTFTINGGNFSHAGTLPAAVTANGTTLSFKAGSVLRSLAADADLFVGDGDEPGGLTTSGLTLSGGAVLATYLHGATPRIAVNGPVAIAGLLLVLPGGAQEVPPGASATLIDNDGIDPIAGTFSGLDEGATLNIAGVLHTISYVGGTGNDVTISRAIGSYYLSEGATGTFFDTELLIANPNDATVTADVTFLPEQGTPLTIAYTLAPLSRLTVRVDDVAGLEHTNFSTIVTPTTAVPLVVERTMRWDATGYGAHTEQATDGPGEFWMFAEGSEGVFFRTFLLLSNPAPVENTAYVTYMRENEPPIEREYTMAPSSRLTVAAADDEELMNRSFGMLVEFLWPGVAERAMYFGTDPIWKGGHGSAGRRLPSTEWFLAEGATGLGFDTFILAANPFPEPFDVTFTFLPESGEPASVTKTLPARSRLTLNIEAEGLPIPEGPVATKISATGPIVVERAQYWPAEWTEAHNSFGVVAAATTWGLAEGRAGGPEQYQTYILLANAGDAPATVTLSFLGDGQSTPPATQTVTVPAQRRLNVFVEPTTPPESPATTFGTLILSDQPIVVERAMYWNVGGQVWAAGTNATGAPLP